jgi:hypothetical protein
MTRLLARASFRSRSTNWVCRWRSAHRADGSDTRTSRQESGVRRVRPGERSATTHSHWRLGTVECAILAGDSGRRRRPHVSAIAVACVGFGSLPPLTKASPLTRVWPAAVSATRHSWTLRCMPSCCDIAPPSSTPPTPPTTFSHSTSSINGATSHPSETPLRQADGRPLAPRAGVVRTRRHRAATRGVLTQLGHPATASDAGLKCRLSRARLSAGVHGTDVAELHPTDARR